MCLLIHTKRKDLLKRSELLEGMKNNDAGFFMLAINRRGQRETIRTLDSRSALWFFDSQPEWAEMVIHCRVPSRGMTKDERGIHGWYDQGIYFAHNRTLYDVFDLMDEDHWTGSDSEYFFRRMFMPLYKELGGSGKAYKDGALCPELERFVRAVCGDYNKFAFVMPDNKVLRYGWWEGDDEKRRGIHFSNTSYLHPPRHGTFRKLYELYDKFRYGR